jgi:hypothetical protein
MSAELIFGGLLVGWLAYEAGGKHMLESVQSLYGWGRLLGGVAVIGFLYWHFSAKPETITESLELAKLMMTSSASSGRVYGTEKRNVTNLMKKKVAADQKWVCAHCQETLDESYEVDHKLALYRGGTNEVENLVALCRNCHGKKTMAERLTSS